MRNADQDQYIDLIPAYALGSLDAEDVQAVGQHLAGCPDCQAELATYEGVVDALPLAAATVEPSPALKGQLMDRIQGSPAAEGTPPAAGPSRWRQAVIDFQGWLAGPRWRPALLLAILILAIGNVYFWREATRPSPNAWRRISLAPTDDISADGQNGAIIVDKLAPLGEDQQYQLWLIADGERTSGAVFSVPADGYQTVLVESPRPLREYEAFGITIEPAGGSPGPTGDRVLGYGL